MCRIAFFPNPEKIASTFLKHFFAYLDEKAGGDGQGCGGWVEGNPFVWKNSASTPEDMAKIITENKWDNGVMFHTRLSSVGKISDDNCHPFLHENEGEIKTITCHNGHLSCIPSIKLFLLENGTFAKDKILSMTDSEIIGYYINKYGFEIASIFGGTILTSYKDETHIMVNGDFEYIKVGDVYIYASEFPYELGVSADEWKIFCIGTHATLNKNGPKIIEGSLLEAKLWYDKKRKKYEVIDVA